MKGAKDTAQASSFYCNTTLGSQDLFSSMTRGGKYLAFLSKGPRLCTHFSCDFTHSSPSRMVDNEQGLLYWAPASSDTHTLLHKSA